MANEILNIVVEAKDNMRQGLNSAVRSLGGFGSAAMGILQGVGLGAGKKLFDGIVGGIEKAAGVLPQLIMEGTQLGAVENTFENLAASIGTTADAMIRELRPAARGMVSDAELMQAANKFMSMGLAETSEEAAGLTEMATQLAIAMGKDATFGMESFALMLANQSIQRLDEFGISSGRVRQRIDELMDATEGLTREDAFKMAVFEEGAIAMDRVGEQGDGAAAAMARLGATFENLKNAVALAAVPFVENFAPVIQEFVDENAPKLFETLEKISTYLFGRPGGMVEDPITGMLRIDPGQVGAAERWASELRRILTSIGEGDWSGAFQPFFDSLGGPDAQRKAGESGAIAGERFIDGIAAKLGSEEASSKMADGLGKGLWGMLMVPNRWSRGATMGAYTSILKYLGVVDEAEAAWMTDWYIDRGLVGAVQDIGSVAWERQMSVPQRDLLRLQQQQWIAGGGIDPYALGASTWAMQSGGVPLEGMPGPRPWSERALTDDFLRALPLDDLEVEVYPKPPDPAEWRQRGHEAMTQWIAGAEQALGADVGRWLERNALLHAARAYGVR